MSLEAFFVAIAGLLGGFVSTLASDGSSIKLPGLEFFGLPGARGQRHEPV